jgi:hypothetical protein
MSDYVPNQIVHEVFHEYGNAVGLVQSDFVVHLYKDGVTSIIAVTITEIGLGEYHVSFTPDSIGIWSLDITRVTDDGARYGGSFAVREPVASQSSVDALALAMPTVVEIASGVWDALVTTHLLPGSFGSYINRVRKYTTNRLTQTGTTYSVKEDNGVDEFESGITTENERTPQ